MQPVRIHNTEEVEDFQHFVQAMSQASVGTLHLTGHIDPYTVCTLTQIYEEISNEAYNKHPERFPQGPPPEAKGCQCGQHDIENAILKGEIPDDPGNA